MKLDKVFNYSKLYSSFSLINTRSLSYNSLGGIIDYSDKKTGLVGMKYYRQYSTNDNSKFFKGFHSLDDISEDKANFLINSMKSMMSLPCIQKIKQLSISDLLNALPFKGKNAKIIEIGCGHGADARLILDLQKESLVTAIDSSLRMINQAKSYSAGYNIDYRHATVGEMTDRNFDAIHADRLFTSSDRYPALFSEVVELAKPGGVISITDVDADSIFIEPNDDITQKITNKLIEGFVNKKMGSKLEELFIQNNISNIKVTQSTSEVRDFKLLKEIFDFDQTVSAAVSSGEISSSDGALWFERMQNASDSGKFCYTVSFYTVQGESPKE